MRICSLFVLLLWGSASLAAPVQYDFTYTFTDGESLYGSLTGTLQPDADTIQIDSLLNLHYTAPLRNDCCLPDFSYDTLSDWNGTGVVSLSGATMDFVSNAPGPSDSWALTSGANIFDAHFDITCLGVCGDYVQSETFNTANWAITVVPVPPAVFLFGSGLGLLGWLRRRAMG